MADERYIHIPYKILRSKKLSDKAKLLYGLVQGFWEGDFKASNEWIAKTIATSPRNVTRLVTELVDAKLVFRRIVLQDNKIVGRVLTILKQKGNG